MSTTLIPPISIALTDHRRLTELAALAYLDEHPVADFLLSEIQRARVEHSVVGAVVSLGKCVAFRVDADPPESRVLVLPQDYRRSERHISVLSPVGAALLGLRVGDRMPFVGIEGFLHFVDVIAVENFTAVVDFALLRDRRAAPDEPPAGPSAA